MPLFLFASGYLYALTRRTERYLVFLRRKAMRLMVPYLSTSVIVISIKLVTEKGAMVENPVSPLSFVEMFYSPAAGYFLWFIWVIWWMFMVVPLLRTPRSRLIAFAATLTVHFLPVTLPEVFCLNVLKRMGVYFMLGVCWHDWQGYVKVMVKNTSQRYSVILSGVTFVIVEYLYICTTGLAKGLIADIAPYIGILFILTISTKLASQGSVRCRWLLKVAECTYIIYLFHTTFEGFAKAALARLLPPPYVETYFIPVALSVITIGVVCPILLQLHVLNRSRYLSVAFGLGHTKNA